MSWCKTNLLCKEFDGFCENGFGRHLSVKFNVTGQSANVALINALIYIEVYNQSLLQNKMNSNNASIYFQFQALTIFANVFST